MGNSYYDHVGVLLDNENCLQIGPPSAKETPAYYFLIMNRKPLVLRLPQELRHEFLQNSRDLLEKNYDYMKALATWTSLVMHEKTGIVVKVLEKHPEKVICTDGVLGAHPHIKEIRKKYGGHLDYASIGAHSLNDYLLLAEKGEFEIVKLPFPMSSIVTQEGKNYTAMAKKLLQKDSVFSSIVNLNNVIVTARLLTSTKRRKFRNAYRLMFAMAQVMKMMRMKGVEIFQILSFVWPRL